MKFDTLIKAISGILLIIGAFWGVYKYVDVNYAKAAEVKMLEQRLEYKIVEDQRQAVQERIWKLDDRYHQTIMPDSVKEEYRQLQKTKEDLERKLENLEKKDK